MAKKQYDLKMVFNMDRIISQMLPNQKDDILLRTGLWGMFQTQQLKEEPNLSSRRPVTGPLLSAEHRRGRHWAFGGGSIQFSGDISWEARKDLVSIQRWATLNVLWIVNIIPEHVVPPYCHWLVLNVHDDARSHKATYVSKNLISPSMKSSFKNLVLSFYEVTKKINILCWEAVVYNIRQNQSVCSSE